MRGRGVRGVVAACLVTGAVLIGAGPTSAGPGAPVVQITINKVVLGDDPGVAFAIVLTCTSSGVIDGGSTSGDVSAQDFQIPNNGSASETVQLANGESTVVNVTLPPFEPDTADCAVTEDLADTTLPAGFTCSTPAVEPPTANVYDGDGGVSNAEFTVTNTCAASAAVPDPVEAVASLTG